MASRVAATGLVLAALGAGCSGSDRRDVGPAPQPERARLVFGGGMDGYLYTVDPDGSDLRRLTRGRDWGAESVAWAPDRSRIAFITVNVRRGSSALVVMRADGSGQRRLATFSTEGGATAGAAPVHEGPDRLARTG